MSIALMVYADASARAVAAAPSLLGELGPVYVLPSRTVGVATPPMGLLAVHDEAGRCLETEVYFDAPNPPLPASWSGSPHAGLPEGIWGSSRERDGRGDARALFPTPSLQALGALSRFAAQTGARVWILCDHERGDSPYDQWAWLFAPARPRSAAYEQVFAYGGDAGIVLWQRDLIGPDPWRVLADEPAGSPHGRLVRHLALRGSGLPGASMGFGAWEQFRLVR